MIRTIRLHDHLFAAFAIGGVAALLVPALPVTQRLIVGWDVACILFLLAALWRVSRAAGADDIRHRAEQLDEGGRWVMPLSILAALIALAAVAFEGSGKDDKPAMLVIALMIGTLILSWSLVQILFALHYAHEFYAPGPTERIAADCYFPAVRPRTTGTSSISPSSSASPPRRPTSR